MKCKWRMEFHQLSPLLFLLMFFILFLFWLNTVFEEGTEIYAQETYKCINIKKWRIKSGGFAFISSLPGVFPFPLLPPL